MRQFQIVTTTDKPTDKPKRHNLTSEEAKDMLIAQYGRETGHLFHADLSAGKTRCASVNGAMVECVEVPEMAMKLGTVKERFQSLFAAAHDGNPPPGGHVQHVESERMFYAGFKAAFMMMVFEISPLSDDDAEKFLETRHKELDDYFFTLAKAPRDISRS